MIYLDNAATTIQKPESVARAVYDAISSQKYGNPSRGSYTQSLDALRELMNVRMAIADFFGMTDALNVVLFPNITYGINFIMKALFAKKDHIITSITEHNSVLRPLYDLEKKGCELSFLDINDDFSIKIEDIEGLIKENTKAVVITAASNVSGRLTDLKRVNEITRKNGLKLIIDGAQIAGCVEFSLKNFDDTIFLFTGHKSLHGPQGTGAALIKGSFRFEQVFSGGSGFRSFEHEQPYTMPDFFEPGTANIHSFSGLRVAINELNIKKPFDKLQKQIRLLYDELKSIEGLEFYSYFDKKNAPIISFNIRGADANVVGQRLFDEYEICVRAGSHCAPLFHKKMGTVERGIVRLSISSYTTNDEIMDSVAAIRKIADSYS